MPDNSVIFWCKKVRRFGIVFEEWDADIDYAAKMDFEKSEKEYSRLSKLTGSENCFRKKIENQK
jgi:hypothetical protein